jgi:tetratricopeptide (TPR) repeat protein
MLVVLILARASSATAQPQPDIYQTYQSVLASYARTGDISNAVIPIQQWSGVEFDAVVKATMASKRAEDLETAAVVHLEIGVALMGMASGVAAGHFKYGSELLERWTATQPALTPSAVAAQKQFRGMWYGVAGSAFAAVKYLAQARPMLNRATAALPRSARARTLVGTLAEFEASLYNLDDAPTIATRERSHRARLVLLYQAEQDYREALRYDEGYALAHIRLGHVLHLAGKLRDAHASLDRGRQLAKEPLTQYLAALFTGALQQDEKELDAARRSFEQAVTIAPNSQPPIVALAYLELITGRPDRANTLARGLADAQATGEPWWAFHNGALDISGLRWLRQRVMR